LDSEFNLDQFDIIEERIEKLIGKCRDLEKENIEMKNGIAALEARILSQEEIVQRQSQERSIIKEKINHIVTRLAEIEHIR
jgi:hypothetical protein